MLCVGACVCLLFEFCLVTSSSVPPVWLFFIILLNFLFGTPSYESLSRTV